MASPEGQSDKEKIRHLCAAAQAGNIAEVETILQQGMFINADEGGNTMAKSLYRNLLMLAIDSLQVDMAKHLIDRGIDVNHKTWGVNGKQGARDMAVESGLQDVVAMIDAKLPVSKRLFYAAVDGEEEKVRSFVKHIDADMNMKIDLHGDKAAGCSAYTLLMIALKNGHVDIANFLIDQGIDLDFEHQEWDRPDANSEPILVESYDAHKLAMETGMVGVANTIDKRRGYVVNGNTKEPLSNGVSHHEQELVHNTDGHMPTNATTQPQLASSNTGENITMKQDRSRNRGCTCVIC